MAPEIKEQLLLACVGNIVFLNNLKQDGSMVGTLENTQYSEFALSGVPGSDFHAENLAYLEYAAKGKTRITVDPEP